MVKQRVSTPFWNCGDGMRSAQLWCLGAANVHLNYDKMKKLLSSIKQHYSWSPTLVSQQNNPCHSHTDLKLKIISTALWKFCINRLSDVRCGLKGVGIHSSFPLGTLHWFKNSTKWTLRVRVEREWASGSEWRPWLSPLQPLLLSAPDRKQGLWFLCKTQRPNNSVICQSICYQSDNGVPYPAVAVFVLTFATSCLSDTLNPPYMTGNPLKLVINLSDNPRKIRGWGMT